MRNWRKKALWGIPAVLILCFAAYEAAAVVSAKLRTPAIMRQVASRPLQLASVPKRRLAMLLAIEDPGFYEHSGVDFSTPGQGMTTITQSLVKQLYFDRFEPGLAKIEQSLIARFVLDEAMSKEDQLEVFLNRARFGRHEQGPIVGFSDAARAYYGKDLASLTDDQYLSLVAMLIGPRDFDPARHKARNDERTRRIKMLLAGRCRPSGLRDVYYEAC